TLTVTTDGGAELEVTDVPAVQRLRRSLLVVADDIAERLRIAREERWQDHLAGLSQDVAADGGGDDGWEAQDWAGDDDDDDEPEADGPSRREVRRRGRETSRRLKALQAEVRRAPRPDSPVEDDGLGGVLGVGVGAGQRAGSPAAARAVPPGGPPAVPPGAPPAALAAAAPLADAEPDVSDEIDEGGEVEPLVQGGARILRFPGRP
ncbi:MAG: hypothetical protein ACXV0U_06755, partial [Kineosporiaceae bacterium]